MKIMLVLGTRPEIIRLSRIIPKLSSLCDLSVVHTGQNYDQNLSDIFFKQLGLPAPRHLLGISAKTTGEQIGRILIETERLMLAEKPDRLLILGDTNSGLSAIVARRLGIPVYHMEAGNRCYDDRVPEETNRRIIDHSSTIHLPYTEAARRNLLQEGLPASRIFVTGNPIYEVLLHYRKQINASKARGKLGLKARGYFLVTLHRAENVDNPATLKALLGTLEQIAAEYGKPVVVSTHPRTQSRMEKAGIVAKTKAKDKKKGEVLFLPPFGFFDFVKLQMEAFCVLTDSGTVQEECAILKVPNVTLRETTERPETIEVGSNIVAGTQPEVILRAVKTALALAPQWQPPAEYLAPAVSDTVLRILLSK